MAHRSIISAPSTALFHMVSSLPPISCSYQRGQTYVVILEGKDEMVSSTCVFGSQTKDESTFVCSYIYEDLTCKSRSFLVL